MVAAPFLGSVLVTYFNWRSVFLVLTLLSILALGLASFMFKETNLHRDFNHLKPAKMKSNFIELIKSPGSFQYACFLFASFGLMTAWLTAGSVLLQDTLHLSYLEFGYCALWVGFFYFVASLISSRSVSRVGEKKLIQLGASILIVPPFILLLGFAVPHLQVILIVASVAIAFFGTGFIIPNAYSLGVKSFARIAGMAGAFFGFAQMFGGSVYSFVISCLGTHSILPLWLSMVITVLLVWRLRFASY
jgi:DHA1 family bicyclomycin/chloramphenicol resistance-like MFS transporter